MTSQSVMGVVVQGHGVASGKSEDPRFPGGTLEMQAPFFSAQDLDLSPYFPGTLNLSIAPWKYQVLEAPTTFHNLKWSASEPAEDFSFFDCRIGLTGEGSLVDGLIYYPHPETKPKHFQPPDVLEILAPELRGVGPGTSLKLEVPIGQMVFNR